MYIDPSRSSLLHRGSRRGESPESDSSSGIHIVYLRIPRFLISSNPISSCSPLLFSCWLTSCLSSFYQHFDKLHALVPRDYRWKQSTQTRLPLSSLFILYSGWEPRTHSSFFKRKNWHVDDLEHSELYPIRIQSSSWPLDQPISPFVGRLWLLGWLASGINENVTFALSDQHITMFALRALTSIICAAISVGAASPQVRLGTTTLVGRDVTLLKQDFFGGKSIHNFFLYQRTTYFLYCCRHPFRGTTSWESSPPAPSAEDQS